MADTLWQQLAASFSTEALTWRIVERAPDQRSARVRPQLRADVVRKRLDTVLTLAGWSYDYQAVGQQALICVLQIQSVRKSAVVRLSGRGAEVDAEDAFVYAAEHFGIRPAADTNAQYWVDYDPESDVVLYEPGIVPAEPVVPSLPTDDHQKPAGQQAIDKLIERLKGEGLGLEVAKLVNSYGGYGRDAAEARELYSKLRQLYKGEVPS